MPKCTILVGVPGSGKSTWVQNQEYIEDQYIASTDDIVHHVATMYGMTYNEGFKDLIKFADRVMWRELAISAEDGERIYIDRTNMSIAARKKFIDFLKPYGYTFDCVVFDRPEDDEEWERRLDRSGKTIPWEVINGMLASFQMPTEDEGFESITVIEN